MEKKIFEEKKKKLVGFTMEILETKLLSMDDIKSLEKLLEILHGYSFENQKNKKGTLTRTIIDSLELDYSIGEKFIEFDNNIKFNIRPAVK